MATHPFIALAEAAKIQMLSSVKPGEIPGRTHPSLTGLDVGIAAFDVRAARQAAAEHGKTCEREDCQTHETLTRPSVRIMAIHEVPIFGPQIVERLFVPDVARAVAASFWAGADLAEAKP